MTDSNCVVACDAGPIIHLDELNQLSLLFDFSTVFVTQAVAKEVEKHRIIHFSSTPSVDSVNPLYSPLISTTD
jgi:hypothetical protein